MMSAPLSFIRYAAYLCCHATPLDLFSPCRRRCYAAIAMLHYCYFFVEPLPITAFRFRLLSPPFAMLTDASLLAAAFRC